MPRIATCLLLALVLLACGDGAGDPPDPNSPVVATFATPDGETFRAEITRPDDIARVRDAADGDGGAGIPNGVLVPGDGGVNTGHDWHMVDVEIVDVAIEVCDGTASMVDADLDYWLDTVGRFCPWDATVVDVQSG